MLVVLLAGVGLVLWLALRPPPPEKLFSQAKKLMESDDPAKWDQAVADRGPVSLYLKHYYDRPGEETKQVRKWQEQAELSQCEWKVQNFIRKLHKEYDLRDKGDLNEAEARGIQRRGAGGQGQARRSQGCRGRR